MTELECFMAYFMAYSLLWVLICVNLLWLLALISMRFKVKGGTYEAVDLNLSIKGATGVLLILSCLLFALHGEMNVFVP